MMPDDDPLDADILSAIHGLAAYPARDPEMEAHGVEIFLAAARIARDSHSQATIPSHNTLFRLARKSKAPDPRSRIHRPGLRALAVLSILLIAIFGAGGATSLAAREALPGDAFYPVKTIVEEVRIQLSSGASQTAELHILFANRRLDELSRLAAEQRFDNLESTVEQLGYHSQEAVRAMQQVADDDPTQAQEIAAAITDLLSENVTVLTNIRDAAPVSAAPAINQTLIAIQLSPAGKAGFDSSLEIVPSATALPPLETPLSEAAPATEQAPQASSSTPPDGMSPAPAGTPQATPQDTPGLQPVGVFDLDVVHFRVGAHVKLDKAQPIQILLDVKNNGLTEGQGMATVSGLQNGVEVYRQSLPVSDAAGGAPRRYSFPEFTPTNSGEILWTVSLSDDDPDLDEEVESTRVEAGDDPGSGAPGNLDLDIQNFKIPASTRLSKKGLIEIELDIKNNGTVEGQGSVTISGVQNGIEVYSQTLMVTDAVGGRSSHYVFPGYASAAPGEIVWTITLSDGDPDADTVTATTRVEP